MQYAILFDRLFRFPVTGSRVRNYDGLGGQLLFAYLHRHGFVHWTDNRLTIEWERVADGVAGAARRGRGRSTATGIDRSKLAHWSAAHDLVVALRPGRPPARAGRADVRDLADVEDPRPLHRRRAATTSSRCRMFYTSLKRKLEPVLARRARDDGRAVAA